MAIRVVSDTNILVSALLNPRGNESMVVQAILAGLLTPCFSDPIIDEYRDVLSRPRFSFPDDVVAGLIAIMMQGIHIAAAPASQVSPDPDDSKFIACAVAAGAAFLVTGNRRHFPEPRYGTALVVSARELLARLGDPA